MLSFFDLSGRDDLIFVTAKFATCQTQSRWTSSFNLFCGWQGAQICSFISVLISPINHVWWKRWQRSEFPTEPEWSGWGSWIPGWFQRSKCEGKENAWWGVSRLWEQLFRWDGYKKIKIREEEEEVIEGV